MKAVIFAGGKGKRLKTEENLPKPLVSIKGIPIIDRIINSLKNVNIDEIFILVNHKEDLIRNHFNENFGKINLKFIKDEGIGTLNAINKLRSLKENFILLDGDSLFNPKILSGLINYSTRIRFDLIRCITDKRSHPDYKVLIDKNNIILDYGKDINGNHLEAGISICSPIIFKEIPKAQLNKIKEFGDFTTFLIKRGYRVVHCKQS
jgi:NDP-sugar pyrophosphorylase family protein